MLPVLTLVAAAVVIVEVVLFVWALASVLTSTFTVAWEKALWVVVIVVLPVVGPVVWLLWGRRARRRVA